MTHFVVFDFSSGEIIRSGNAQDDETARLYGGSKLTVMINTDAGVRPGTHYVQDGGLVPLPQKPAEFHDFDYTTKQWVANPQEAWASVKYKRTQLLTVTDWMVTKATESGQLVPPAWSDYRQALRDITLQVDPWAIVWPVAP